ncbi:hypothetical protein J4402_02180 [Candidatus Pacearchaeota archaeon]|nr:hypothetical protein [uncultured archaeon]AQS31869.1 hypothetical protein [uncultured archaeon]MBS3088566.1 hypothetical protein [Candidatus Pacearchaeota archaeon]
MVKSKIKLDKYFFWIAIILIIFIGFALVKSSLTGKAGWDHTDGVVRDDETANENGDPEVTIYNPPRIWYPPKAASKNGCRPNQENEVVRTLYNEKCEQCKKNNQNEFSFVQISISNEKCVGDCVDSDENLSPEEQLKTAGSAKTFDKEIKDSCLLVGGSQIYEAVCGEDNEPKGNIALCPIGTSCLLNKDGIAFCGTEEQKAKCGEACYESIMCQNYPNSLCIHNKCEILCDSRNNLKADSTKCNCIDICDDENPCTEERKEQFGCVNDPEPLHKKNCIDLKNGISDGLCLLGTCTNKGERCEPNCIYLKDTDESIKNLVSCAKNKVNSKSEPCFKDFEIFEICTGYSGLASSSTGTIILCENSPVYQYKNTASTLIKHELIHMIDLCRQQGTCSPGLVTFTPYKPISKLPKFDSCAFNKLSLEFTAYLCSGECSTKESCLNRALYSVDFGSDFEYGNYGWNTFTAVVYNNYNSWLDEWWEHNGPESEDYVCDKILSGC